jgi:hypothetical protein
MVPAHIRLVANLSLGPTISLCRLYATATAFASNSYALEGHNQAGAKVWDSIELPKPRMIREGAREQENQYYVRPDQSGTRAAELVGA